MLKMSISFVSLLNNFFKIGLMSKIRKPCFLPGSSFHTKVNHPDGKFNGDSYNDFLSHLMTKYSCPVFLIEDRASYHKSKIVKELKEAMEKEGRLFVYRLPSYSPDKNPIEKLWKNTKNDATHCKYFPTFEALRSAVIKAFKKYMEDALKVICVMKKLREKAGIA